MAKIYKGAVLRSTITHPKCVAQICKQLTTLRTGNTWVCGPRAAKEQIHPSKHHSSTVSCDWLLATSLLQLTCARRLSTIPSHENPQIDRDSCRCKPLLPELASRAEPFHCRNCPFCPRGRPRTHESSRQIPRRQP